jgi:hypothetical protein
VSYTTPTAADFKARFPEFGTVPDSLITAIIAEQEPQVGPTWEDRDRRPALLHLVAHMLSLAGWPAKDQSGATGNVGNGRMKRRKVGDVEVEYATAASGGAGGGVSQYASTSYGQTFLTYLRRNFAGARVV